ncbi:RES family NAD+ phosphorylase [Pseudomaricurvus alcaniphilus]|uniref:RES domain-containing protein n=1 Tax=Pseudomaricurvus alcaniphilus TaxID=1166482 RepID=UPI00140D94CE|nr:RES family NAD+ phosphorylase [Pseudomaricurvus alcaniphilus]
MSNRIADLAAFSDEEVSGYRLINAKFPPIDLFDDVADPDEFEALYELQALTNPRLQTEIGNLRLLSINEIPFSIRGCSYAAASFTHVNPDGSRFSDGSYGLMYIAESSATAIAEVTYHQHKYWQNVTGLRYDRFVFKELVCTFGVGSGLDATNLAMEDPIYAPGDYTASRALGWEVNNAAKFTALKYSSVRRSGGVCHALFTPREVRDVIQARHFEMIWDGQAIKSVNNVS